MISGGGGSSTGASGGSGGASQGTSAFKTREGGKSGPSTGGRGEADLHFEPQYPDESDTSRRIDISTMNNDDDSDEEVIYAGSKSINREKGKELQQSHKGRLKPVRLE